MVALVLTAAFGVLGALSIYFARRDEEGRTFFWTMATLCALAFGFSLGSFNQDAQLRNQIAALNTQLESSGTEVSGPPAQVSSSLPTNEPAPPADVAEPVAAEMGAPGVTGTPNPPLARREPSDLPEILSLPNTATEPTEAIPTEAIPTETTQLETTPLETTPLETEPVDAPSEVVAPVATVRVAIPPSAPATQPLATQPATQTEVTPAASVPTAPVLVAEETSPVADAAPADLSGIWEMTTTIERTAYPAFAGLELTFRLDAEQNADNFAATGNKAAERAPGAARTLTYAPSAANRIMLTGNFTDADTLALSFEEGGVSGGTMTLRVVSAQRLEGVFLSSSADSGGSVVWRKVSGG